MRTNTDKILIVGLGNLGSKIAQALNSTNANAITNIMAFTPEPRHVLRAEKLGISPFIPSESPQNSHSSFDIVILCVKPNQYENTATVLSKYLQKNTLVISCLAGVSTLLLANAFGGHTGMSRIMPNLAVAIQKSNTAYCVHTDISTDSPQYLRLLSVLTNLGHSYAIPESLFDAFTAIAGSGIAYIATFIDTLVSSAVREGMTYDTAYKLILDCMESTTSTLRQKVYDSPKSLCTAVSSPGGITIAGLSTLLSSGFQKGIFDTISESVKKSQSIIAKRANKHVRH